MLRALARRISCKKRSFGFHPQDDRVLKKKAAFTLAEVLITLGIIGIVAAMTLPTLIQKNNNKVVVTRLKKFYSVFNQAIDMAEVKYGDIKYWFEDTGGVDLDENGNPIEETAKIDIWFQKYLSDFIVIKKKIKTTGVTRYYLSDGSSFQFGSDGVVFTSREIIFYPGNPDKCPSDGFGICKFEFELCPNCLGEKWKYLYNRGLEPCKFEWDGTREWLLEQCRNKVTDDVTHGSRFCSTLIQYDNWEIADDYPYKVAY